MIRQIWISGLTTGSLVRRLCQLGGDAHVEREQDDARLARMDAAFLAADGGTRRRAGHLCRHRRTELRHVLGRHLLGSAGPPDGGGGGNVAVAHRGDGGRYYDHGQFTVGQRHRKRSRDDK